MCPWCLLDWHCQCQIGTPLLGHRQMCYDLSYGKQEWESSMVGFEMGRSWSARTSHCSENKKSKFSCLLEKTAEILREWVKEGFSGLSSPKRTRRSKPLHNQLDGRICAILWKLLSTLFSSSVPMHPSRFVYWFDDQIFLWSQLAALFLLTELKSATTISPHETKRDLQIQSVKKLWRWRNESEIDDQIH